MKTNPSKRLFFQKSYYKNAKMAIEIGIRIGSEFENIDTRLFIE